MSIRPIRPQDLTALAEVYVEAFAAIAPEEAWSLRTAEELLSFFLKHQADLAYLSESDGRITGGILGLCKPWWNGNRLVETELFVSPTAQHLGTGRLLLKRLIEAAKSRYDVIEIEALTFKGLNFPANWYARIGFEDDTRLKIITCQTSLLLNKLSE